MALSLMPTYKLYFYQGYRVIIDEKRTRYSQVTHYFFHDCLYYTPMLSDPFLNKIAFRNPVDIQTGKAVNPRYIKPHID